MTLRKTVTATLAAGAALTLAVPAFADCADELEVFDGQLVDAGLQDQTTGDAPLETAAGADTEASKLQALDEETQSQVVLLVSEARAAVQAGDEAACEARLREARELIAQD